MEDQEPAMDVQPAAGIQYHDVTAAAFRIRRHGGIRETPLEVYILSVVVILYY